MNKEQALEKIKELKKFVSDIDNKKEVKVIGIAIKNRFTGSIIFQSTKTTYKEAIIEKGGANLSDADLSGADLRDADLSGANLSDANLRDADLRDAELNSAKFYGRGGTKKLTKAQLPDFLAALGFIIEE